MHTYTPQACIYTYTGAHTNTQTNTYTHTFGISKVALACSWRPGMAKGPPNADPRAAFAQLKTLAALDCVTGAG